MKELDNNQIKVWNKGERLCVCVIFRVLTVNLIQRKEDYGGAKMWFS